MERQNNLLGEDKVLTVFLKAISVHALS